MDQIILTEKRQDPDQDQKCGSDTGLVEELWNQKEDEDGAIDQADGSKDHVDSKSAKIQPHAFHTRVGAKTRGQKQQDFEYGNSTGIVRVGTE